MRPEIQRQLIQLNREFYATVAADFDATRGGLPVGWQGVQRWLPPVEGRPLRLLDVGCGNGRFAWLLDAWGLAVHYIGVDADAKLLTLAQEHATGLDHVQTTFLEADFTAVGWPATVGLPYATYDLVVCFAALHHVPGSELRRQCVQGFASLVSPGGALILSHWQFLTSARFVRKQIAWQTIGLSENDVEPGDALLPWNQGAYAIRYVHQVDEAEAEELAAAAGLHLADRFYADGKEGNLNLYTLLYHRLHSENDIDACEEEHEHH